MIRYRKVLVTGGAGFIGSHLVDGLLAKGYQVRVMDNLYKQIHSTGKLPKYFNKSAEFFRGDVTKRSDWKKALKGIDAVYHFASAVGVGQSMYEIEHYVKVNSLGTALLLDLLANESHSIKKMIVAASMSSYGEGLYKCKECALVRPTLRSENQISTKDWGVHCPKCNKYVDPIPTPEDAKQFSNSIYAISKKNQEEMVLNIGAAYNIPAVALRYFNVYGTRQSLSNPYNGVVAIFMSRVKNHKAPVINEDGLQSRDFIHIQDVTSANIAALESSLADYQILNVGSGVPTSIYEIAKLVQKLYLSDINIEVSNKARKLDVRHCYADNSKLKGLLNWRPKVTLEKGLKQVMEWSKHEEAIDLVDHALKELSKRGLR